MLKIIGEDEQVRSQTDKNGAGGKGGQDGKIQRITHSPESANSEETVDGQKGRQKETGKEEEKDHKTQAKYGSAYQAMLEGPRQPVKTSALSMKKTL